MKILVTGATGFIGSQVLKPLFSRGFEVHALGVREASAPAVRFHPGNLMDPDATAALVKEIAPGHLLHLAWNTEPGKYWTR